MRLFLEFPMLGRTSILALCIPKIYSPNLSLCRDIESSVVTEFSVFVFGLCLNMQFFVATSSLYFFSDYIPTYFDNVTIEF